MSTISVPIPPKLEEFIDSMVESGRGANKADVVRRALEFMAKEEAIKAVLEARREPTLRGDLEELAEKI